jgi:hypothetical protein
MAEQEIKVTIVGVLENPFNITIYQSELDEMENQPSIVELQVRQHLKDRGFEIPEHNLHFGNTSTRTKYLQKYLVESEDFILEDKYISYYYVSQIRYDMDNYFNETWYVGSYFDEENTKLLWGYIPLPFSCEYEFHGCNDLYDAKCVSNNLSDQMVIDILNRLIHDDILILDEDTHKVWIVGNINNNSNMIQLSVENSYGEYFEDFVEL